MLRLIVLLLLLANGGFYAWSQGLLLPWGLGPAQQSEPQRLAQQIRPEAVRVLSPQELQRNEAVAAQAPGAPECLESAVLEDSQATALRGLLAAWPAGSWSLEQVAQPASWIVYMGPYAGPEQLARKRAELRQLGLSFAAPADPRLAQGLSLGSHASEAAAAAQLDVLAARGVRTARVLPDRPELRGQRLLLPAVDDNLRTRLAELRPALDTRTLRACR